MNGVLEQFVESHTALANIPCSKLKAAMAPSREGGPQLS